jgi:hypothetical protein
MPKGKIAAALLPKDAKFQVIDGQNFVRLRDAAKIAGIHPVVLEMGKELLSSVGGRGASFALATPELQKNADALIATFKGGLRRFAKAMEPNRKLKLKAFRDGQRLVFWYSA